LNVLALETSTEHCSVALLHRGGIGFGAGPGSFTGLRIACGVAQGLALGAGLKVAPVGTLLALAQATHSDRVVACLDARMGEVYHAAYERRQGRWHERVAPNVCRAQDVPPLEGDEWWGAGSAFRAHGEALRERYRGQLAGDDPDAWPQAAVVARLAAQVLAAGGGVAAEQAAPLYVRDRVALKMHEQR
jgi:tRNA threonylcarbamoyladenosine biosynthesis protein TsaB